MAANEQVVTIDPAMTLPKRFGSRPFFRFAGFFGGLALLIAGIAIAVELASSGGGGKNYKFVIFLIIAGLGLMATSFAVTGVELRADGLSWWAYKVWFFG